LANEQKFPEIPIAPPAPNIFSKSPGRPVTKAAIEQPPAARGNTTNSHSLSAENLQTPRPASPLTQSGTTSAGSSAAAPETTNELPGAGIAGGKISALESKAPAIPAVATGTIEIILDPYPSIRMPAESQKQPSRPGTSLQIGRLVSRIEPVYPPEALRQRLAGTVKVHAVVSPEGTVEASAGADAPAMLSEAALRAIRQWRFEPTLLGGSAIGVEEDITVVFRIAAPHSPAN
jgi:TonB family protein